MEFDSPPLTIKIPLHNGFIFFNYTPCEPEQSGFRGRKIDRHMNTDTFIKINKSRIQNIDGNLDTATITVLTPEGKLAFYWFENGVVVGSKIKVQGW
jgi:hypothetical protein